MKNQNYQKKKLDQHKLVKEQNKKYLKKVLKNFYNNKKNDLLM